MSDETKGWTADRVREHLTNAVYLEMWTIPLYLTAAYSIKAPVDPTTNRPQFAPATAAGATPLPAVIAPSGSDRLALVVHADTWADIKDGSGFRLVYDLLRSGSSVELTGEAPFAVFLGNGHGVELQYNGEPVDFSADIRDNNTARLNIGE